MNDLKLVPANQNGKTIWSDNDYDVTDSTGEFIGRIYARASSDNNFQEWWWGLSFPFTLNAPGATCGRADRKEVALNALAEQWRASK